MIIALFHVLYLLGKYFYQSYLFNKNKELQDEMKESEEKFEISEELYRMIDPEAPQDYKEKSVMKFFPPAYVQRYVAVGNVLNDPKYKGKLRKVVDFGCSELGFLRYLKNTTGVEEILCVDIDRVLLLEKQEVAAPLVCEYLHCRTTPLTVEICEGSVTHNDKKLEKTDAVICIELVEHLYPDTLRDVPFNIFGFIRPKVAIITTPNADFNVLFPNFSGFRHPDHKFEWTREQFQNWAKDIVRRYPDYSVTFEGICKGPEGTEDFGACTQMAIFHRHSEKEIPAAGVEGLLKTVAVHEYPFRVDNRSDEQKILDEAAFYIRNISYEDENIQDEVALEKLLEKLKAFSVTMESLRTTLVEGGWAVVDRDSGPVVLVPQPSTFSDYSVERESVFGTEDGDDWNQFRESTENDRDVSSQQQPFYENWNDEAWEEEPSIVIPQSYPITEESTYLFDGENLALDVEMSEDLEDIKSPEKYSDISYSTHTNTSATNMELPFSRSLDRISLNSRPPSELNESSVAANPPFPDFENPDESSFNEAHISSPKVQKDANLSTAQRLNRMLDFQAYMSTTRSSTSPEPYLLCQIQMENLLKGDNSFSNQSTSEYWMLNNTFAQSDSQNESQLNVSDNTAVISKEYEYAEVDLNSQMDEHINCTSMKVYVSDSEPQFTSSPKVLSKTRSASKKRDSARFGKQIISTIEELEPIEISGKNSLESTSQDSANSKADSASSTSTNYEAVGKWYENENAMYQSDPITLKGGSDVPEESHSTIVDGDLSASSTISDRNTAELNSKSLSMNNSQKSESRDALKLDNLQSVIETTSNLELVHAKNTGKTEPITELDHSSKEVPSSSDKQNVITDRSNVKSFAELEGDKILDNAKGIYEYTKDVATVKSECTSSNEVQSTSVLTKFACKDTTSLNTVEIIQNIDMKPHSPEALETPPNSWSPEIMDSGYPNSASAQDMTPEYDLSSISRDQIPDSESPSVAEAPRIGMLEPIGVENGDLANNNRDGEGNNMMAAEADDLEDLQPLIDVLENDLENENAIYVLENGFPVWLLRMLEMNPIDLERDQREPGHRDAAGGDAVYVNDRDEGFDSSSSSSSSSDSDLENDVNSDANDDTNSDSGSDQWTPGDM